MPRGTLEVILISAKDLHDSDFFGKMDPYVILSYRTQEHRSSVAKGAGSKPQWNESFLFTVSDSVSELNLRLMDQDLLTSDDFLGEAKIDLEPVFAAAGTIPETSYNVVKDQKYCGEVKVALAFNPEVTSYSIAADSTARNLRRHVGFLVCSSVVFVVT
ncbi:C2 domain-containing protein [Spatholobus suberectus]|nr:C2 domain-containing protein [Spatholobus suberectus]